MFNLRNFINLSLIFLFPIGTVLFCQIQQPEKPLSPIRIQSMDDERVHELHQYLIKKHGLTPEQIQELVNEAQNILGKTLMTVDGALRDTEDSNENKIESTLVFIATELELEINYFSTIAAKLSIEQLN